MESAARANIRGALNGLEIILVGQLQSSGCFVSFIQLVLVAFILKFLPISAMWVAYQCG